MPLHKKCCSSYRPLWPHLPLLCRRILVAAAAAVAAVAAAVASATAMLCSPHRKPTCSSVCRPLPSTSLPPEAPCPIPSKIRAPLQGPAPSAAAAVRRRTARIAAARRP